ncbi:MAG TPA: ATP-binding protein [Terriglobales bacterium]|nr:ATP-binding protein [Terriglobales bacterium]
MTGNRVSYTLESSLTSINTAEETALKIAAQAGFDDDESQKISMAVREAAVNAVLHGNAYDPQKKMTLAFESTGNALVITVTDQGQGLDPNNITDPLSPENLLKQSGRGIFLMRAFMDEVRIRPLDPNSDQSGTEVTMIKNVRGESAQRPDDGRGGAAAGGKEAAQ